MLNLPVILTIGVSDNLGGAGIQADLKTFQKFKCYGTSAVIAVTAQSYYQQTDPSSFINMPAQTLIQQVDQIMKALDVKIVKIGMLNTLESIDIVHQILKKYHNRFKHIIADLVLTDSTHCIIFPCQLIRAIRQKIIPLATVITPNVIEYKLMFGLDVNNSAIDEILTHIKTIPYMVVVKCGNLFTNELMVDICWNKTHLLVLQKPKLAYKKIRGDGCILSAAIAANLAQNHNLFLATIIAKQYTWQLIQYQQVLLTIS